MAAKQLHFDVKRFERLQSVFAARCSRTSAVGKLPNRCISAVYPLYSYSAALLRRCTALLVSYGYHYYFTLAYFDRLPLNVFQCDWCSCWCCRIVICFFSLCWGRGSWLGCGYCWPWGWFHPAGVWAPGQPKGCFGHLTSTCNKCC